MLLASREPLSSSHRGSLMPPLKKQVALVYGRFAIVYRYRGLAQLGERHPYKVDVIGSSPITSTIFNGLVAQLVEHVPEEHGVVGSIPAGPTITFYLINLSRDVAQLGTAPGLGPGDRRFKSCHPDHYEKS